MQLTTLNQILQWAEQSFNEAGLYFGHGTNNAWDEAVMLAAAVLKLPPDVDASIGQKTLTKTEKAALILLVERRINERIPVPYLTHEAWFAGLKFYVDERVLIPRSPFAELILKGFQPWLGNRKIHRILDLCTGGGCIAIACASVFKDAIIDAVDISEDALAVARQNIHMHQYEDKVRLYQSDLFSTCPLNEYDIIISNPPYVAYPEWIDLPLEYQKEPKLALEAGKDGLDLVNKILKEAPKYLRDSGLLWVEVGNASLALQKQFPHLPLTWMEFERGGEGVFLISKEDLLC